MERRAPGLRFAGFLFDPATGELTGPEATVRLAPKAARLLELLLERPGELVPRERLRQEIWPDQHVELDQVLAYTVRQVRAALGDEGGEPRFVETLPRRGYRFLAAVEATVLDDPAADSAGLGEQPGVPGGGPDGAASRRRERRKAIVVVAIPMAALVVLVAAVASRSWRAAGLARPDGAPVRVALLPLGEPGLEAANDPLTEALVVALTAQPSLAIVGPATTERLRYTDRPHTEVGRELDVAYVASGGFRPAERFLFLQLVRSSDGEHIFARRYLGDAAEVQQQLDLAAGELAAAAATR
jgi:transcriptional activator of cad operon